MAEPRTNKILDRSDSFAIDLIRTLRALPKTTENIVLLKQVFRSGTSIGANAEEAVGASTRVEFARCMTIARKEARETRYWLRLLLALNPNYRAELTRLGEEANALTMILNKIIATTRRRHNHDE